jgi:hypothetical protein
MNGSNTIAQPKYKDTSQLDAGAISIYVS